MARCLDSPGAPCRVPGGPPYVPSLCHCACDSAPNMQLVNTQHGPPKQLPRTGLGGMTGSPPQPPMQSGRPMHEALDKGKGYQIGWGPLLILAS